MAKQIHHAFPGRASMGLATSSVTSCKEGSPSTHSGGGSVSAGGTMGTRRESSAPSSRASSYPTGMAHLLQIRNVGSRAELFEHLVRPLAMRQERHAALRVLEIAEHDG